MAGAFFVEGRLLSLPCSVRLEMMIPFVEVTEKVEEALPEEARAYEGQIIYNVTAFMNKEIEYGLLYK